VLRGTLALGRAIITPNVCRHLALRLRHPRRPPRHPRRPPRHPQRPRQVAHAVLFGFNAVVFLGEVRLAVLRGTLALGVAIITPYVCRHLALRLRHPRRPSRHPRRRPRHLQRPRQVAHAVLFGFNAVVFLGEVRRAVWKGAFALGKATTTPSVCQHRG